MTIVYVNVQPTSALRKDFATWCVQQNPKVRTASTTQFAVPSRVFTTMPEHLLIGAIIDGHPYVPVSPDAEPEPPHPPPSAPDASPEPSGLPEAAQEPDCAPEPEPDPAPAPNGTGAGSNLPPDEMDGAHACADCPRTFTKTRGLRTHRRQAHADTED